MNMPDPNKIVEIFLASLMSAMVTTFFVVMAFMLFMGAAVDELEGRFNSASLYCSSSAFPDSSMISFRGETIYCAVNSPYADVIRQVGEQYSTKKEDLNYS